MRFKDRLIQQGRLSKNVQDERPGQKDTIEGALMNRKQLVGEKIEKQKRQIQGLKVQNQRFDENDVLREPTPIAQQKNNEIGWNPAKTAQMNWRDRVQPDLAKAGIGRGASDPKPTQHFQQSAGNNDFFEMTQTDLRNNKKKGRVK